jgi:hypothetical protein
MRPFLRQLMRALYFSEKYMGKIKQLDLSVIESVSKVLGETTDGFTGTELGKLLCECRIDDIDSGNTKWRRLNNALSNKQYVDGCSNNVVSFIQHAMNPARHYDNLEWFNDTRFKINKIISFEGLSIGENGKVNYSSRAETITEAAARASKLKEHLVARKVHPDVIRFCREELVVDNYFHAVFEATKSVAEKIRIKTGLTSDGASLVDDAFSFKGGVPHLAFNSLQSESEKANKKVL